MKFQQTIFLLVLSITPLSAQITGNVDYKYLGVSFTVPEGWQGQETEEAFLMGSNSVPGILMIAPHPHTTLATLKAEASAGFVDGNTSLYPEGGFEQLTDHSIGGLFTGVMEGQPVKSYIIGLINPHGSGVTVLALTTPEAFSDQHIALAKQLAGSVKFRKPEKSPIVDQWKEKFTNARLTYMDSYYSSGPSYDGYSTGGGYNSKTEIDLCSQGFFNFNSNSSMSVDTGGAFAGSASSGKGQGTWEIQQGPDGSGVLVLHFHNGEVKQYNLSYDREGKTFLNGYRYFVTYGETTGDGPNCY